MDFVYRDENIYFNSPNFIRELEIYSYIPVSGINVDEAKNIKIL